MKYRRYICYYFIDKNLLWIQIGFWILFFLAFNMPTHALYHNKLAVVFSLAPTLIGLVIGTTLYRMKIKDLNKNNLR